jgi:HAD superfamily hydrolase (TIGR01509 family)
MGVLCALCDLCGFALKGVQMIKVCVFDMGRVMLDFDFERFYATVLPHCRPGVGRKELEPLVAARDNALGCGLITFEEYFRQFREAGVELPRAQFEQAWKDIFTEIPETTALLRRLSGVKKVMLSNTDASHIAWVMQRFDGVMGLFEQHYFSYVIHVKKPFPEAFRAVEKGTGFAPSEHVLIDDLEENIRAAQTCGWQGIVFRGAGELAENLRKLDIAID